MSYKSAKKLIRARDFIYGFPPIHPFLFGIFPIFSLYSLNIDQLWPSVLLKPTGFTLFVITVYWLIIKRLVKNNNKAAIAASLTVIFFFSFGYIAETLEKLQQGAVFGISHYTVMGVLIFFPLLFYFLFKSKEDFSGGNFILNLFRVVFPAACGVELGCEPIHP